MLGPVQDVQTVHPIHGKKKCNEWLNNTYIISSCPYILYTDNVSMLNFTNYSNLFHIHGS